jgi:hypothetical protein
VFQWFQGCGVAIEAETWDSICVKPSVMVLFGCLMGSNLSPKSGYNDPDSLWFLDPQGQTNTLNLATTASFSLFSFTVHRRPTRRYWKRRQTNQSLKSARLISPHFEAVQPASQTASLNTSVAIPKAIRQLSVLKFCLILHFYFYKVWRQSSMCVHNTGTTE